MDIPNESIQEISCLQAITKRENIVGIIHIPANTITPTPPLKTIFPAEFVHTNYTIDRGHKT